MLKLYFFIMFLTFFLDYIKYYWVVFYLSFSMLVLSFMFPMSEWGGMSNYWGFDCMGYLLSLLTIFIVMLGLLSSYTLVKEKMGNAFGALVLTLLVLLFISFSVNSCLLFYIFFEVSLVPLVVIVVGYGNQPEKMEAGLYMLFYTIFGSLPLLLGFINIFESLGSLSFCYILYSNYYLSIFMFPLIMMALFIKLPVYFVHLWLPKAHVEAPVFGSMVLAGIVLKLGGYGLVRLLPLFLFSISFYMDIVVSFSLVGGSLVSLLCLSQSDLKSLVAYSSVGHMMMLMGGVFSYSYYGYFGALIMMVAHGLTSSGLFSIINMLYERVHSRSMVLIRGLILVSPFFSFWWFLLSVSNMAAPPFLNLGSELCLSFSLIGLDLFYSFPLGLMFFISGAYSIYFFSLTNHGNIWGNTPYYSNMDMREGCLIFLHLVPLLLLVFKFDLFVCLE